MLKHLTMGQKIASGFVLVTVVLLVITSVTIVQLGRTSRVTTELLDEDQPAMEASIMLLSGVNKSLAALRGWVLIGEDRFKDSRAAAWTNQIQPALATLQARLASDITSNAAISTSTSVTDLSPQAKVQVIQRLVTDLQAYQDAIEDVAQSPENIRSYHTLETEATPKAVEIMDAITSMIDVEQSLEATPERKTLLVAFANFRGSFAGGLADLRAYLLSGEVEFRNRFESYWSRNEIAYDAIIASEDLLMETQQSDWQKVKAQRAAFEPLPTQIIESRSSDKWNQAIAGLRDDAVPAATRIQETLESLLENDLRPRVVRKRQLLADHESLLRWTVWICTAVGVLVSLACGLIITSDFNRLARALKNLLGELSSSSQEIHAATQQQVASMTEATSSVNEISSTSEEFKATIQEFVDRVRAVRDASEEMSTRAADGLQMTKVTEQKNSDVRLSFEAAGENILRLSEQMQQITQITTLVNEIAEQTKLLALNASIEAARAGEEGRGFAVVATQVRELANQSKEASGRIASQINGIQGSVQTVINSSEQGHVKLMEATDITKSMAQSFQEIALSIDHTTDAMRQMDQAARQQETGIADLVTGIAEINAGSSETLTTAEQTQLSIASIEERAHELNRLVKQLTQ